MPHFPTFSPRSRYVETIERLGGYANANQISEATGIPKTTVRVSLFNLHARGRLTRIAPGVFAIPGTPTPEADFTDLKKGPARGGSKYLQALRQIGKPARVDDIANEAFSLGHAVPSRASVIACLKHLTNTGQAKRVGWGLYEAA